ncbi:MAG TPA: DUF4440 domain-containing protein [Chitinophagaceae bacterium]
MTLRNQCLFVAGVILFYSCSDHHSPAQRDRDKAEVEKAEKDFASMAATKGIAEAFWFYADSNAVIKRKNDTLIRGKENIRQYYSADSYKTATVTWSPDFVDVSENGDMAYTYGKYTWQIKDSTGKSTNYKGVFHTVWKRQADGSWKYVWD